MKKLHVTSRNEWRQWLADNHDRVKDGIWLVSHKKNTGKAILEYGESVEEALCYGWIDSTVKSIGDQKYCRRFTPRRDNSHWSTVNKKRVATMIKEGRMTEFGLAKVDAAKSTGRWPADNRPEIDLSVPTELSAALAGNKSARDFFEQLAQSYRKQFIGWIVSAKRPETQARRVKESLALLAKGRKLYMK